MSLLQLRKIFREIATKIWLVLTEFSDSAEQNLFLFLDFSVFKTIFHFRLPFCLRKILCQKMDSTLTQVVQKIKAATKEAEEKDSELLDIYSKIEQAERETKASNENIESLESAIFFGTKNLFHLKADHATNVTDKAIASVIEETDLEAEELRKDFEKLDEERRELEKEILRYHSDEIIDEYEVKMKNFVIELDAELLLLREEYEILKNQETLRIDMEAQKSHIEESISKSTLLNELLRDKVENLTSEIAQTQKDLAQWRILNDNNQETLKSLNEQIRLLRTKNVKPTNFTKPFVNHQPPPKISQVPVVTTENFSNTASEEEVTENVSTTMGSTDFVLASNLPQQRKFKFKPISNN